MMLSLGSNIDLTRMAQLFRGLDDFVICGHVNPDGDCIGSALALGLALQAMGKRTVCLLATDAPVDPALGFLPGFAGLTPAASYSGTPGAFVACDVSVLERIGEPAAAALGRARYSFTVDHHACDAAITDYTYVDTSMASTTMIVWELLRRLPVEPDADMALCAFTGLVTDTGNFKFQNTGEAAFAAAAQMVAAGVEPFMVSEALYQTRSLASFRLEAAMLEHLEVDAGGRFALSRLSQEDFERSGAAKTDAELMVDVLRSIGGVSVTCLVRETAAGARVSLRAKDGTDVAAIAARFGGGGHKAASGCTIPAPFDEALAQIRAALTDMA